MPNRLLALFAVATLFLAGPSGAHSEDTGYTRLAKPQPVTTGKKIELTEFFWYRCPHCHDLEPALNAWLKKLPKDVHLHRIPAVFRDDWVPAAKLYYALQDVGADRLHGAVFEAYHLDNLDLDNPATLMDWVAKKGVDRAKFEASYNSFSTQSKANRGVLIGRTYGLKGVPSFAVDGKYVTSESIAGSREAMFATLDKLIIKARKERAGKKPASAK